jgi:hypothetical protein
MKKFNGFEAYLILEGLKEVSTSMKEGIEKTLAEGKMPLMTTGYVDMVIKDAVEKVNNLTAKTR